MIWTLCRARGYLAFSALVIVTCGISWAAAAIRADLPLADGPRVVRQYVVAFLPAALAPVLIDRLPEVSASLARSAAWRVVDLVAYWSGMAMVLVPTWLGVPSQTAHYEVLIILVLSTIVTVVSTPWGINGSLIGAVLGAVWVLSGGAIATAAGFPGVARDPWSPIMDPAGYVSVETIVVAIAAAVAFVACARVRTT
jgi:hypothetical protein